MMRIKILFILVGIVSTVRCKGWSPDKEVDFHNVLMAPGNLSEENDSLSYASRTSPPMALASVTPSDVQTLLTYSANPVQLGQSVNFTCTRSSGRAFANSSNVFLSAWLYVYASDSQTQVAFGSATSTANSQTVSCVTLASLSGRAVQCTFSATEIVFSLSNVIVSDEKLYGCQVFTSTNAAYSVWWATSLKVYAPPQQPVMHFYPSNPIQTGEYLQSVTCAGNVGNPDHKISLFYQPAANPNRLYLVASNPSVTTELNADGTATASYTFYLPGSQCQYEWSNNNNTYRSQSEYQQYTCTNIGGNVNFDNNGDVYSCVTMSSNDTSILSNGKNTSEALVVHYGAMSPEVQVSASTLVNYNNNYDYNYNVYSSSYNISVDECVTLTCSSSGNPAPTVLWIQLSSKANQSLAMSNFVRNKSTTYAVATGYFQHPDSLTFVCFVSNTGGSGSRTFTSAFYKAVTITVHPKTSNEYHASRNNSICDFSAESEKVTNFGGTVRECSPASANQFVSTAITSTTASKSSVLYNSSVEDLKSDARTTANQIKLAEEQSAPEEPIYSDYGMAIELLRRRANRRVIRKNYNYSGEAPSSNSSEIKSRTTSTVELFSSSSTSTASATSELTTSFAVNDFTFPDGSATQVCDNTVSLLSDYYKLLAVLAAFASGATLSGIAVFVLMKITASKPQNAALFESGQKTAKAKVQTAKVQNKPRDGSAIERQEDHYFCQDETSPILVTDN